MTRIGSVFIDALRGGSEHDFEQLKGLLADQASFTSAVTEPAGGPEDVIATLRFLQMAGRFAPATAWSHAEAANTLVVTASMPIESFYDRFEWTLTTSGESILEVVQKGLPQTKPLPPSEVVLSEEIDAALTNARESRNPVVLAYVNPEGRPSQSPRGTTQVLDSTRLAFWNHNPNGSFIRAIADNAAVSIHYWGGIGTTFGGALSFEGIASVSDDGELRRLIYEGSPSSEQRSDPNRGGCAVIVQVDRVVGFLAGRRYNMSSSLPGGSGG